ncbi:MAG TPA: ribosome-associated translation inhibitor RaiA [Gammaproteobacteria bacterium]|jgi:putative sigma-54 modulation protein|nr:ribosome-associated translation inhibitor RaiA [Gammaproteobacteria bacterium]
MKIDVTGHHVEITDALRTYVQNKFERLERHFDHVTGIHVVLTVSKLEHRAEATLNVSRAKLFADAVEADMYAAIDSLVDKLDRQVKKHKEKLSGHSDRASVRNAVPG